VTSTMLSAATELSFLLNSMGKHIMYGFGIIAESCIIYLLKHVLCIFGILAYSVTTYACIL